MARIRKSERLLNLLALLLKSRRPVTLKEIRESVVGYRQSDGFPESMERRFERDKAALREIGVPLKFLTEDDPAGPGYVIAREAYFLPRIELSPSEAAILATASKFALAGAARPVSDALQSALRKLQFDMPMLGEIRETAEERFLFHRQGASADDLEEANLRRLAAAVLGRHGVRFRYYAIAQDQVALRSVEPYGIGFAAGHWYVAGWDRNREAIRVFRVDRIRSDIQRVHPDASRPEFVVPPDFRMQDHLAVPPWLFGKAERRTVRMHFDAETVFMVRMRAAPGDEWEERPDGSAVLRREATNLDALLNWVLGFGKRVEVLEPPEFRRQVAETLKGIIQIHEGHPSGERRRG